jgi:hypothetical protein
MKKCVKCGCDLTDEITCTCDDPCLCEGNKECVCEEGSAHCKECHAKHEEEKSTA